MAAGAHDEIWENPLVPHAVMKRLYEAMVQLREMEPGAVARRKGARGGEACRASSLLSLGSGDLVSDVAGTASIEREWTGKGRGRAKGEVPSWLPAVGEDALERVTLALGAAAALRVQGGGRLALIYVAAGELTPARWQRVLQRAGEAQLPVIFVVLPGGAARREGVLSDGAQGWGVPGMPVDAADAVALYRVMQESVMRARAGDGPALMECVQWQPEGRAGKVVDGVEAMRRLLVARGLLKTRR